MLKILYAGCLGLSPAISSQFSVEMCAAFENCQKNSLKNPFSRVQGHSRSSMLINLKSLSPVFVMISSMSVSICNRVHTIRANNGARLFRGVSLFDVFVRGELPHPGARIFVTKKLVTMRQPTMKIS